MAIQKVSDLPIFRKNDPDFSYDKVKASLIEMSYKISSDDIEGVSRYQSKAVTVAELADYILSSQTGNGIFSGNIMFPNGFTLSGSVYLNQPIDDDIAEGYVVSAKTGVVDTTALLRYKVNSPTIEMSCSSFTVNAGDRTAVQVQSDSMVVQPRTEFKSRVFVPPVDESSDDKCAVDLGYLRRAMPEIKSPFILFETKYLDYSNTELSSDGWINTAAGQWLSKDKFPNAYEHLYYDFTSGESKDYTVSYKGVAKTVEAKKAKDGHIVCDKANVSDINSIFNALGTAWVYIIDKDNETFMLPRNNMFIRGCPGDNIDAVGGYSQPIMPQHSHTIQYNVVDCGCAKNGGIGSSHSGPSSYTTTSDMTIYSNIVQAGNTVSPAAIQMYLYMYCS